MSLANRYTPLPAISSPSTPVPPEGGAADFEDDDTPPVELTAENMRLTFPKLKTAIRRLSKAAGLSETTSVYSAYVYTTCETWARNDPTVPEFSDKIVELEFVEMYKKVFAAHFGEELMAGQSAVEAQIEVLQSVMWNLSDKSSTVCQRIVQVKLERELLGYLRSAPLQPSKMDEQQRSGTAQAIIGILHNTIQRVPGAREDFREGGAVEVMQSFRECSNMMLSTVALMVQAYLVSEEENERINSRAETFQFLVNILDCAIKGVDYCAVNFAVIEIIEVINKLAANDSNKQRIVESGALPYYVRLMGDEAGVRVQREAAHGLWTLAFKCRNKIVAESGALEGLTRLLGHTDEEVRKQASGALWILQEKNKDVLPDSKPPWGADAKTDGSEGHVFISYQWDAKETVLKVRDRLKAAGFNVWIDEDDMSGSVLEAMATAVEKASVVVVCLSQKYKDSPSCRTEAEYTFRLRKKVVPLRLQPKYYPDGWLGLIVGSQLVFDLSLPAKVDDSTRNLIRELTKAGGKDDPDAPIKPTVAPLTYAPGPPPPPQGASSAVHNWTEADIKQWVQQHGLQNVQPCFSQMTGPLLAECGSMRQEAPEAFFSFLLKKNVELPDALAISKALKALPN